MSFTDKVLICRDCGQEFAFTAGEQAFFIEKGLLNEPQRCLACRAARRRERLGQTVREMHQVTCHACGGTAFVPFVPRLERPVYCSTCFDRVRAEATA